MPQAAGCDIRGRWLEARRCGLTLVELLVVIAIVGVLMALFLPAIGGTRAAARSFKCQASLRSIAFDFTVFADDDLHGWRGDDEVLVNHFRLETFQESQYRLDEFWDWGDEAVHVVPDPTGNNIMRCSEVKGEVALVRDMSCSSNLAIRPSENISYGFNVRMHAAQQSLGTGRSRAVWGVPLSMHMLDPSSPLAWDIDGSAAAAKRANPIFSGPSLTSEIFAGDMYWFPAARHAKRLNACFVDGSVRSSEQPLAEQNWGWGFSPVR